MFVIKLYVYMVFSAVVVHPNDKLGSSTRVSYAIALVTGVFFSGRQIK